MKCLVCGGAGFIGSHLVKRLVDEGHEVISVDIKEPEFDPVNESYRFVFGDLRIREVVSNLITSDLDRVYQLAADMGGAGYINTGHNDAEVIYNSLMINLNVIHECDRKGVKKVFFSSSACVYNEDNQLDPNNPICVESSAYPANPDTEYGWEKLFSERLYSTFKRNRGVDVRIGRFHNVYGPKGTYDGGKEKVPAALCRKVSSTVGGEIEIWGDGKQTRSFLYIDDCLDAVELLMDSDYDKPINIGSEELITINDLAYLIGEVSGKDIHLKHIEGPIGVNGRRSDNTLIESVLGWKPKINLREGIQRTYEWIDGQINKDRINKPVIVSGELMANGEVLPIGNPPDWKSRFGFLPVGGPGHREIIPMFYSPFPEKYNYKLLDNVPEGSVYLTFIHVFHPSYFYNNKDIGFKYLNGRIIKDLKENRTRLIIIHDTEGMSGIKGFYGNDFNFIDRWIKEIGVEYWMVTYFHGNLHSQKFIDQYQLGINVTSLCVFEGFGDVRSLLYEYEDIIPYNPLSNKNLFLSINRNPRFHRMMMISDLLDRGLFDRGFLSFTFFERGFKDWFYTDMEMRGELIGWSNVNSYREKIKRVFDMSPQYLDRDTHENTILTKTVPTDLSEQSFLFLVTETLVEEETLFISEKTFKPIALGMPFIVYGSCGTLEELQKMGYQTFSKWFDESYDKEIDFNKRLKMIIGVMEDLSQKPVEELIRIREEMSEVLRYNKEHYRKRIYDHFYLGNDPKNDMSDYINHSNLTFKHINGLWHDLKDQNISEK